MKLFFIFLVACQLSSVTRGEANLIKKFAQFGNIVKGVVTHAISQAKDAIDNTDGGSHLSCATCEFAVNLFMTYIENGKTNEEIAKTCITICVTLLAQKQFVCRGAVNAFVHDVVHIMKTSPGLTEKDVCGFVLGQTCQKSDFQKKYNWTISLPSKPNPATVSVVPPPDGLATVRILHLSDTHLDPYYQEGANAVCGLPLCCRETTGMTTNAKHAAGKWGDYRNCDAPEILVEDMLRHIAKTSPVDYIFWTGDLPAHDIYNQSKTGNIEIMKNMMNTLSKHFPNTPIFPALGNHEGHPVNSFPQPEVSGEFSISWLYNELSKTWTNLIRKDFDTKTIAKGAYYSVPITNGFRIISLNMNYCNSKNFWLLSNFEDPAQELKWLIKELLNAESLNEKVYILGHIPPGSLDCIPVWSRNFHAIVNRFENTIAAQFYGHTHYDELLLFYDELNERPTNIAYIGPSTTPFIYHNPGYKIYTADGERINSTRMVLDAETYYANLTEANLRDGPIWRKLYSFKNAYEMKSLTPLDWDNFIKRMAKDDSLFDEFYQNSHRKSDAYPSCDDQCRRDFLCRQISARSRDFSICVKFGIISKDHQIAEPAFFD